MTTTYSECVFVVLRIQGQMRIGHIVICLLRLYNIFPHNLKKRQDFRKTLLNTKCVF